jgi:Bacterial Ig domain
MTLTVKKLSIYVLLPVMVALGLAVAVPARSAEAACATNNANLGTVTGSFTIPTTGSYRVWSRIQPDSTTAANNSYTLEVDSGTVAAGSATCNITVGDATIPANTWTWVDYRDGNSATKIDMTLSAGTHTYTLYGRESGVELDRVIFAADTSCVPTGTGDNCVTAADTTAPTTAITTPAANATLSGASSPLAATASDAVGVTKVEFYIDGQIIGAADTTAPYTGTLNTTSFSNGTHSLTTKAYDAANNIGTSAAVSVTISNTVTDTTPPTISIAAPATITAPTTITSAVADAGGIAKVEFYIDGTTLLGTDTTSPYSFSLNPALYTNGAHVLTGRAYDNSNNQTTSAGVNITIANPDTTPPSVVLTAPLNNTTIGGQYTISATAADAGGVARVEFSVDGTLKGTDTTSPYSYVLDTTTLTNASHTISVKSFDNAGNPSTAATATVTVNNAVSVKRADFNGDNVVDTQDLFILLGNFNKSVPANTKGDANGTGTVDIDDLFILLGQFGK